MLRTRTEAKVYAQAMVNAMYAEREVSSDELLGMMGM